jgi:hypothetical protein
MSMKITEGVVFAYTADGRIDGACRFGPGRMSRAEAREFVHAPRLTIKTFAIDDPRCAQAFDDMSGRRA